MTAALTPNPKAQFFAADGTPLVGGKLYSYAAGTTTPLATYINYAGVTANTNPVILDSRGEANVWLDNVLYKLALYDANDALIWTVDNVSTINNGIFSGPVAGTTGTFSGALTAASGTFTSNVQMASLNGGQLAGLRNKIINGKMEIAQRGTSFPAVANAAYSLDRWVLDNLSAAVLTITQQADAPSSNEFRTSCRLAVTTADTSIAAGDVTAIGQLIEGYNVRDLIGRTFTLSFWVRSSKTGTHCVSFSNSLSDRSFVFEYTISAANTWEYKTFTVSGGLITAGTWNWTTGIGLSVRFALASGSTFNTTAGAWQTGNFTGTANQVNCLDTIGNIFAITGVQLEVGSVSTPFEHRPIGLELALCQRYFETIQYLTSSVISVCQATSTTGASGFGANFAATKRSTPAVAYATGSANALTSTGSSAGGTILPSAPNQNNFNWAVTSASGLVAGNAVIINCASTLTLQAAAEL